MKAEIIATGTEILLGEIVDTNTSFLAGELAGLGIDIHFASSVGDNFDRLSAVLRQAWQRSAIIITTGGLGPTQGDITRNVIASVMGEEVYVDEGIKRLLSDYFARMGTTMSENNIKQATLIPSATALLNPLGTAPGWWVEKEGRIIIALPGPPAEMQTMWRSQVMPRLKQRSGAVIVSRVLKTWGLSESKVDELVRPLLASANPTLAMYARQEGIVIRITAKSATEAAAREMIAAVESGIRQTLGDRLWGVDDETMAGVVGRLLEEKNLTLAVGESMTGGYLTCNLASELGASPRFRGGIVASDRQTKIALGLEPALTEGASLETAAAMAAMARRRLKADIGIGLDGDTSPAANVAQPGGAPMGKIYIAVDTAGGQHNMAQEYAWRTSQLARRAGHQALFTLRRLLLSW